MNLRLGVFLCVLWTCRLGAAIPASGRVEGRVTLADNGRVRRNAAEVVVWIEGTKKEPAEMPTRRVAPSMTSLHKKFTPRVIVIPQGGAVTFPNEDPIFHNVFSVSGQNRFDLGLYRRGKSKEKIFDTAGLVRVYCNIHPQMIGYVRVVDSDFSEVTGPEGSFSFGGVPAGERSVRAWCEEGGETSVAASVRSGKTATVSLTLDISAFKPEPHKNKYGKDYPPPPPDEDRY